MKAAELRQAYVDFFCKYGHVEISGQSLVPDNDPTVLFTTAGMHPLVPYLLGQAHPGGVRLVNCQRCVRTGDIDAVGDTSHLTFFEMLGNWSLGDYFKEESLTMSYQFLTDSNYLGLNPAFLSVTVFEGDSNAARDEESAVVWHQLGIPSHRIYFLPASDNWWGPAGKTGPCGPDSEIFYDTGKASCSASCAPGCSCGKYFEIWNNVFMQYNKDAQGLMQPLQRRCVDTGMGVERTTAMLQGLNSVFDTELFAPLLGELGQLAGRSYRVHAQDDRRMRIIADHCRSAVMMLADPAGILPSNLGRGYILRRLIRRAARHGRALGLHQPFLAQLVEAVSAGYGDKYLDIVTAKAEIKNELQAEEERFHDTLVKGEQEFARQLPDLLQSQKPMVPGRLAFRLYDTFGFPLELTQELAAEHGLTIDQQGFDEAVAGHREESKKGVTSTFKGGLADHGDQTTRYHTATHLLHEALRRVLGEHVQQKGSNITAERLRFDFAHHQPMTPEEIQQVEQIVNQQIAGRLGVSSQVMLLEEAKKLNVRAFFEGRYGEQVSVYRIGDFSAEVCGGPHVNNTAELGKFSITREQSCARGIRRIRAVLE